jgi:site-specific recombinase XerC
MLGRSPLTWKKYARSLGMWLNFLLVLDRSWDEATEDAEYFKEWRLTELSNPQLVQPSTFATYLAGLRAFYKWAARRYQVVDPVAAADDFDLKPRGVRREDVKWLDPAGYRSWRDLGFRVLGLDGRADRSWRGRNEQRDTAFVDGLYRSGLRLTEWASVLLTELPEDVPGRGFRTEPVLNAIGPWGRRRLFRMTKSGLEPLAVWLNENGMLRTPHSWQHTLRVRAAGRSARRWHR